MKKKPLKKKSTKKPDYYPTEDVLRQIEAASIWKPSSIEQTPHIKLASWQIFEVDSDAWPGKTRHFCGYNLTEREGRVSSAIVEFDEKKMVGITKSGRVYQLCGGTGNNADGLHVFNYWCKISKITKVVDVSADYADKNASE